MATLTAKKRSKLPKKDFALPGKRKFPINDKAHAANAKARAEQMENSGKISKSTKARIDAKANKVLDKGKMKPKKTAATKKKSTGSPREKAKSKTVENFKKGITSAVNRNMNNKVQ